MPSPGEDIQSWSVTAIDNENSDPLITWVEHQARASVNNSARSMTAALAKNRNLNNGSIVTTGTANAQAFLSGVGYTGTLPAAIPTGLRATLKVGAGLTNTGAMTLNMDGLGDVLVKNADGLDLRGLEFSSDGYVDLLFNGTNWIFLYSREFFWELVTSGGGIIIGHQIFNTPGTFTYTPTQGMECAIIECIGGGGGGGGGYGQASALGAFGGGGGGSGGYSRRYVTAADIGAAQTVVVGIYGVGDPSSGAGGGGQSYVGALCIANGGLGGGQANAGLMGLGGAGAPPGTGDIAAGGAPGVGGLFNTDNSPVTSGGGQGGSSAFGGGGRSALTTFLNGGGDATSYGSGGGGGISYTSSGFAAGGHGSSGIVIITEFAGRGAPGADGAPGATGPMGPAGPSGSGTGDVLRSGTPTTGQYAVWTDASHIQGVTVNPSNNVITQVFTADGIYTPTSGMLVCIIECIGGGGGGGGVTAVTGSSVGGGGGGSGAYSRKRATAADIGASKTVIVGVAGDPGIGGIGGGGGDTSVGSLCVAKGGSGGTAGAAYCIGGLGGSAALGTGDVRASGMPGFPGGTADISACLMATGSGGSSVLGGGGRANAGTNGAAGQNYGSGGAGGHAHSNTGLSTYNGGAGSAGLVIITEYT